MIMLVIAILSALSAPQGGSFNITLNEPASITLDPCMFFEDDLKSSGNYSPGTYTVVVSYGCEAGRKEIVVRSASGEERTLIDIVRVEGLSEKIVELHKEVLSLRKEKEELSSKRDYLQSLVAVLNDINVQLYDKNKDLAEKNAMLSSELDKSKAELENCSSNFTNLQKKLENVQTLLDSAKIELDHCNSEIESLRIILNNSSLYLELFKNMAILALAFVVGVLLTVLRRF